MFLISIYKVLPLLGWYFLPHFLCKMLKLLNICRVPFSNGRFQLPPKIFNWIGIRNHCWPFKKSTFSLSTIPVCFWRCALGLCLAGGPMIFASNQVFLQWARHFTLELLDYLLISWCLWYGQGLHHQMQPHSIMDPPPCLTVGMVFFSLKASLRRTYCLCALPKSSTFVSSVHKTLSKKAWGLSRFSFANNYTRLLQVGL